MKDFVYYAPTEVVFGKESEAQIGKLVRKYGGSRVLVHYGGSSAERSGLLDKVCSMLEAEGLSYVKLGGVVPNPRLSLVHKGIEICREQKIDFLLAVGGGSVIDSVKAISTGVNYQGDVWDFFTHKASDGDFLPLGCVLTIPAAGSEMSDGSVITNEDGNLKKDFGSPKLRCKFAVMNPVRTFTLPAWQTACGATDMIMHTMERYFSHDDDMEVTDAIAEALMRTVKDSVSKVLAEPENYEQRAQLMWAGSLCHNDLTGCGTSSDWATHNLEHELSGMFDVSHGAGLAAIWGSWARFVLSENPSRFARFAVNVMGVDAAGRSATETALEGIAAVEAFYHSIGMPASISELLGHTITEEQIAEMAFKCSEGKTRTVGGLKVLSYEDMVEIYRMANK